MEGLADLISHFFNGIGQYRTHAAQQTNPVRSFVGAAKKRQRHGQVERLTVLKFH
jgi:hypothetical protein